MREHFYFCYIVVADCIIIIFCDKTLFDVAVADVTWFCVSVHIAHLAEAIAVVKLKDTAPVVKPRLRHFCNGVEKITF